MQKKQSYNTNFKVYSSNMPFIIFEVLFGIPLLLWLYIFFLNVGTETFQPIIILICIEILIFILFKGIYIEYNNGLIIYHYLFLGRKVIYIDKILKVEIYNLYAANIFVSERGMKKKITLPLKMLELNGVKRLLELLPKSRESDKPSF